MIKLTIEEQEFELVELPVGITGFTIIQKKTDKRYPLLPFKEQWNDPVSETIERVYKAIKIADKYYSIKPLKQ